MNSCLLDYTEAYKKFLRELIISVPKLANAEEIEILINSYSKIELAELCILLLEVIREKNKIEVENVGY